MKESLEIKCFHYSKIIMVRICVIALGLWLYAVLVPRSASLFRSFPEVSFVRNVFFFSSVWIQHEDRLKMGLLELYERKKY